MKTIYSSLRKKAISTQVENEFMIDGYFVRATYSVVGTNYDAGQREILNPVDSAQEGLNPYWETEIDGSSLIIDAYDENNSEVPVTPELKEKVLQAIDTYLQTNNAQIQQDLERDERESFDPGF